MAEHLKRVNQQILAKEAQIAEVQSQINGAGPEVPEWKQQAWFQEKTFLQEQVTELEKQKLVLMEAQAWSVAAGRVEAADDRSYLVAKELVALPPEQEPPATQQELESFLRQPLGQRLPLRPCFYAQFQAQPENRRVLDLVESNPAADVLSNALQYAITSKVNGTSEVSQAIRFAGIIDGFFQRLYMLTGILPHRMDRDLADMSSVTCSHLRPDFCLWIDNTLVFKGEHKARSEDMNAAVLDLRSGMGSGWSPIAFGNLKYLPCYAAAGSWLKFFAIFPNCPEPASISDSFDVSTEAGCVEAVRATINMFRLLRTLQQLLPPYGVAVGEVIRRANGTTITIFADRVRKEIKGFVNNNRGVSFEDLASVYSATRKAAGLIHAVELPTLNLTTGTYKVFLAPLGCRRRPWDERELRLVLRAVLQGVAALHAAGFVHRDIHWENVLCTGQDTWVLTDLESAARAPARGGFRAACWTEDTLDPSGAYTTASDMHLVGMLMETCNIVAISWECAVLRDKLLSEDAASRPSAVEALSDHWFSAT